MRDAPIEQVNAGEQGKWEVKGIALSLKDTKYIFKLWQPDFSLSLS